MEQGGDLSQAQIKRILKDHMYISVLEAAKTGLQKDILNFEIQLEYKQIPNGNRRH